MDAAVELDALKLRVSLMEEILMRVWVSEIASASAQWDQGKARGMATVTLKELSNAIPAKIPTAKGASTVFSERVSELKSYIETFR